MRAHTSPVRYTVTFTPAFSEDRTRVDLTIAIEEGPQTIVDHVIVVGNRNTAEDVIRREIVLQPGAPLGLRDLLERTEVIYWDFRELSAEIAQLARRQYPECHEYLPKDFTPLTAAIEPERRKLIEAYATQAYVECWRNEAFDRLKRLFAPGTIWNP